MPSPCLFMLAFIYVHKNTFLLPLEFTPILRLRFTVIRFSTNVRLKTCTGILKNKILVPVFLEYANKEKTKPPMKLV